MDKCYFCKRVIWPWQMRYLGSTPAHAFCDLADFSEAVLFAIEHGLMTAQEARDNYRKKKLHSYG